MKLSFEGIYANAKRQFSDMEKLARSSPDFDEDTDSFWAVEACMSAYHDCLLAVLSGKVGLDEIREFLLSHKTPEEINAIKYCGDVVSFNESKESV